MSKFRSKVSKFSKPSKPLWQKIQTSVITTMELVPQMSVGLIYDDSKTAEIDNEPDLSDLYAYETFFGGDNPTVLIEEIEKKEKTLDVVKEVEVEAEKEVEVEVEPEVEEVETEVEEAEVEEVEEAEVDEVEEAEVEEVETEVEPEVEEVEPEVK
jgi:hypothetical protein